MSRLNVELLVEPVLYLLHSHLLLGVYYNRALQQRSPTLCFGQGCQYATLSGAVRPARLRPVSRKCSTKCTPNALHVILPRVSAVPPVKYHQR